VLGQKPSAASNRPIRARERLKEIRAPLPGFGEPLLGAVRAAHWRTVEASVYRRGGWYNLNIDLYLGAGAAADAQARSSRFFAQLEGLIEQLLANASLAPAHGFLRQLAENAQRWREAFLDTARRKGEGLLRPSLHADNELWTHCAAVRGRGYRNQVARTLEQGGDSLV
jgi:hypothetical protein